MLPKMSCLQFLVVQLLFAGPQSGAELRRKLNEAGAKLDPPAFSRLMRRMDEVGHAYPQSEDEPSGDRLLCPRRFEVTDLGVALWKEVRAFYTAGNEPPPELVPITTDRSLLPHRQRLAIIHRRTTRQIKQMFARRP